MTNRQAKPKTSNASPGGRASQPAAKPTKGGPKSQPSAKPVARSKGPLTAAAASANPKAAGIDQQTPSPEDWRSTTLDRVRSLILVADPEIIEEVKWRKPSNGMAGVPVWSRHGIVCTGETYKNVVKLTFARGASLADPSRLFNSSLEGNTRRAIDLRQDEQIATAAFQKLIQAAVAENLSDSRKQPKSAARIKDQP